MRRSIAMLLFDHAWIDTTLIKASQAQAAEGREKRRENNFF